MISPNTRRCRIYYAESGLRGRRRTAADRDAMTDISAFVAMAITRTILITAIPAIPRERASAAAIS